MRLLTFLSDFGSASPYPAAMKAAAAAICDAVFVDISHDVLPQAIRSGAYLLWSVAPVCPPGTIHCAVVDPGVGTARAALAVASGGQIFVGPDNGLLLPAAHRLGRPVVHRLTNPAYWRMPVSATFHGRDVFAPVAAHLAAGTPLERTGDRTEAYVDLVFPTGRRNGDTLEGEVLWVDPFGNLITSIPGTLLVAPPGDPLRAHAGIPWRAYPGGHTQARGHGRGECATVVETAGTPLRARPARTFADVGRGDVALLVGSDGLVEVAVNGGSAAARSGAGPGSPVRIRPA